MVGGTIFHREVIPREISRALVLNLSGEHGGAHVPPRRSLSLTQPSLLSRATRPDIAHRKATTINYGACLISWALFGVLAVLLVPKIGAEVRF
jgi:hypothetical protein